jgi:hypothetical protein
MVKSNQNTKKNVSVDKVITNRNVRNKREDLDNNNKTIPFSCLKIFHQNICGLQNKINELFIY